MRRIILLIVAGAVFLAGMAACSGTSNHDHAATTKSSTQTTPAAQDAVVAQLKTLGYRLAGFNGFASSDGGRVISNQTWQKLNAPMVYITDASPAIAGHYRVGSVDYGPVLQYANIWCSDLDPAKSYDVKTTITDATALRRDIIGQKVLPRDDIATLSKTAKNDIMQCWMSSK